MLVLIFSIDNHILAIPLENVIRVIWSVYATPLHEKSHNILGMINLEKEILPVLNIRALLNFREKEIDINDQFIIGIFNHQKIALWIDQVIEIIDFTFEEINSSFNVIHYDQNLISIIQKQNRMIFFYDWERLIKTDKEINSYEKAETQ